MAAPLDLPHEATALFEGIEHDLDRIIARLGDAGGLPEAERQLQRAKEIVAQASRSSRPTVAVVGASKDRAKFGNKAVRAFRNAGYAVFPVNPTADRIEGLRSYATLDDVPVDRLDRVSLYVPSPAGIPVVEQAARKHAGEVWLNPGADAPEVVARAEELGLNVIRACSILAVGEHPDQL
jgi:predicted CoA-binding protein